MRNPSPTPAPAAPLAYEFEVSSAESRYAIRGRIVGALRLDNDRMEVTVTDGAVVGRGGPYRNVRIAVGVGTPSGQSWRLHRMSGQQGIAQSLDDGQVVRPDTLHFEVRDVSGVNRERDWLVVQFSADNQRSGRSFTTYICATVPLAGGSDSPRAARLATAYEIAC